MMKPHENQRAELHKAERGWAGVTEAAQRKRKGHNMDVWVVCELLQRELVSQPAREDVLKDPRR